MSLRTHGHRLKQPTRLQLVSDDRTPFRSLVMNNDSGSLQICSKMLDCGKYVQIQEFMTRTQLIDMNVLSWLGFKSTNSSRQSDYSVAHSTVCITVCIHTCLVNAAFCTLLLLLSLSTFDHRMSCCLPVIYEYLEATKEKSLNLFPADICDIFEATFCNTLDML